MIKQKTGLFLIILSSIIFLSLPSHASDNDVATWTKNVLVSTMSVSYDNQKALFKKVRPFYTYNAWDALTSFLGQYVAVVNNEKLTLHPNPVGSPTVIAKGMIKKSNFFEGVHYWMVQQPIYIPELSLRINFRVLVVSFTPGQHVIASMNMQIE